LTNVPNQPLVTRPPFAETLQDHLPAHVQKEVWVMPKTPDANLEANVKPIEIVQQPLHAEKEDVLILVLVNVDKEPFVKLSVTKPLALVQPEPVGILGLNAGNWNALKIPNVLSEDLVFKTNVSMLVLWPVFVAPMLFVPC
jgi:hypothetical protein